MRIKFTILMSIGLFLVSIPAFADPPADAGVTRTQIEGWDNWGWQGGPQSSSRIICPGGELAEMPFPCTDSMTGRVHLRDGAGWSCVTSNDWRMTGIGLYTSNANFDVDANGPVWGEWKIVPMVGCEKDAVFSEAYEDLVEVRQPSGTAPGTVGGSSTAIRTPGLVSLRPLPKELGKAWTVCTSRVRCG